MCWRVPLRISATVVVALLVSVLAMPSTPALAQAVRVSVPGDAGFEQRLGAAVPVDLHFMNEAGRTVTLGSALDGKPAILLLSYYTCPMLCPLVMDGLVRALRNIEFAAGKEFSVVSVSINPGEGPAEAAAKKALYLQRYGRPGADRGWAFLTGDAASIQSLTAAVGFRYGDDHERGQFSHPAGIVLLTPRGRVARYFFGVDFSPRDIRLGLVEAAEDRIGSPIDQLLLLCYRYDADTGTYRLVIMNILRMAGIATVVALGAFVVAMFRRERRQGQRRPGAGPGEKVAPEGGIASTEKLY